MARVLSTRYRAKEQHRQRIVSSRGGSPTRHWTNGGINHKADDKLSTLSRYWTIDRSLARKRERSGGSYTQIKRSLRERGQLFEDTEFNTNPRSLYHHKKPHVGPIVWMRPHEICARPKFIADGATKFDVEQGELGDTWLVQAVSTLTLTPKFLDRVVPPDQAFDHTYCGIFSNPIPLCVPELIISDPLLSLRQWEEDLMFLIDTLILIVHLAFPLLIECAVDVYDEFT
ncbi:calpain-13-like [Penaeus monodon]|uniref:calpain-13-like n=1 Tax=Penaeus monodon TaxID=6687 RepID=UPI0018A7715B|nr:calpain-13-like [Penaeus monodon]